VFGSVPHENGFPDRSIGEPERLGGGHHQCDRHEEGAHGRSGHATLKSNKYQLENTNGTDEGAVSDSSGSAVAVQLQHGRGAFSVRLRSGLLSASAVASDSRRFTAD